MEQVIEDGDLEVEAAIPEGEHIEMIMEGVADSLASVDGTESLTKGQLYLAAVLQANGYIRRNQVGQEGFFSKIGDGLKAAIEYIKKIFRSIYDFFFKRDAPKLVADAKAEVKKAEEEIKVVTTGGTSEPETTKVLQSMRSTVIALTHEPDTNKAALDQILKEADEALKGDFAAKKKAVIAIGHELPKLNTRAGKLMDQRVQRVVEAVDGLLANYEKGVAAGKKSDATELMKVFSGKLSSEIDEVRRDAGVLKQKASVKTMESMEGIYRSAVKNVEIMDLMFGELEGERGTIEQLIKDLESGKESGPKGSEPKAIAAQLREILSVISDIVNAGKKVIDTSRALIKSGKKVFGL